MKKKGFTLIELLGVIIILGILLVIAVPTVTRYLKRGTVEYYHSLENEMKTTGMDYLETYRSLLPRQIGDVKVVGLDELVNNKYIDEVKDEDGKICSGSVIVKKIKTGEYEYYSCLECEGYKTEGESCKFSDSDNNYGDGENYKVVVDIESPKTICQGESFTLPTAKSYYLGNGVDELVSDKIVGRPDSIDTKKLGTTKVKYSYHGASKEIEIKVEDCTSPSKPEVVLKYDNSNGKIYDGKWYSGNIYQKFKSTDYTNKGLLGSGIKEYQVSNDGEIFTAISGDSLIEENSGNHTRYVKSKDNAGNLAPEKEGVKYTFKIDKEAPTCGLKVTSGTQGNNDWYRSNVTVDWDYKRETISSIIQSNINTKSISSEGTTKVSASLTDEAGNIGACSKDIKIDKTNPVVSSSLANGTYTGKQNITLTATDSHSKVNLIYYELYLDGVRQNYGSVTGDRKSISLDKSGKWDVYVRAYDYAGNASNGGVLKQYTYQISLYEIGKTWPYEYKGYIQEFIAPISGTYKLEVWGAQGGYGTVGPDCTPYSRGGYGGYAMGQKYLTAGTTLYIVVGGQGLTGQIGTGTFSGGYNGGGSARKGWEYDEDDGNGGYAAGSGGGATHIATRTGLLSALESYKSTILLVAGGGGGAGGANEPNIGGAGGGITGGSGETDDSGSKDRIPTGGTQTAGGYSRDDEGEPEYIGSFGQGGNGEGNTGGAGGGGYYGGGGVHSSTHESISGAGGSGYIGGVNNGTIIVGTSSMPTHDGKSTMIGNSGHGYAKITLVSIN